MELSEEPPLALERCVGATDGRSQLTPPAEGSAKRADKRPALLPGKPRRRGDVQRQPRRQADDLPGDVPWMSQVIQECSSVWISSLLHR